MSKKIIVANWKMNKTLKEASQFLSGLHIKRLHAVSKVIVAGSYHLLPLISHFRKKVSVSAQDVSTEKNGPRTGDVSASQLKEAGCSYCIIGHSERRVYHGETDSQINEKIKRLLEQRITPILCFGENVQERTAGKTRQVLRKQLAGALTGITDPSKLLFAYEPVWAISTFQKGKIRAATTADINDTHRTVRELLSGLYSEKKIRSIKILYGGSVGPKNAETILNLPSVDGALVGGASLKLSSFTAILKSIT